MNRPLVAVVLAYGSGLLLAQLFQPPLRGLVCASSLLLLLISGMVVYAFAGAKQRAIAWKPIFRALAWTLLALVGWTNLIWRTTVISHFDLRTVLGNEAALVTVRGTLAETPRLKIVERKKREEWHSAALVRVSALQHEDKLQPASGEILVATPAVLGADFYSGQPVEISGVISSPASPIADGLFNFKSYLAARGIYYELKTDSTNDWKLLAPHHSHPPLADRFLNWSHQVLAMGLPAEDEPLRLLWAMTLGWRTAFTGDIDEPFLQAGTMHMFAIDGLRIALVSVMIVTLLRVLRLSRAWCGVIAIPAIWFYTAATGWQPSAMRASVMTTIILGGWMLKRPGNLLNSLAAAAMVILFWDPRQLFEASFQLSFFVMLIIALMLPRLNTFSDQWIRRLIGADPLLPDVLVPWWRKKLLSASLAVGRLGAVSFAAWLGSLPLAAEYFHLFSPVSTFANLFAVPLGALALTANLGALICGHWLPWGTELFNQAAWFFMKFMTWVSMKFARLPGAYFYVPEPSLTTIAIYYAVLIAALSGWFKSARRRLGGGVILAVIIAIYAWRWETSRGETDLTVLPINGGQVTYVDADGRHDDWLINCGNEDAVNFTLKDYLRGQGVNFVPRLVLADGNSRDCGGAARLDSVIGVGELWTSAAKFRSAVYRRAVAGFETGTNSPVERHHIWGAGDTNDCWQMLYPPATRSLVKAGDGVMVLRGKFQGTRVLLLSDLSRAGQSDLLEQTHDLRAEIVIAGIPEDGEPLCDDLIAAIRPRVMVIVDSDFPASNRASRALKQRLKRSGLPVIYTRMAGAVTLALKPDGWTLRAMDGEKFDFASLRSDRDGMHDAD